MLKAIQILGSSSSSSSSAAAAGFVSFGLKKKPPHQANCVALSFISTNSRKQPVSIIATSSTITAPSSSSSLNKADFFKLNYRRGPLFCCSCRAFRMSLTHSDSNPTENSSSSTSASVAIKSAGSNRKINFCQSCGGPTKHEIPDGEEKKRAICTLCGKIAYENPKMVVGCLIEHENKILLCKRKIQPSYGLWTLPAGYMEMGESAADGATRETWEEANAEVEVLSPFAHLDIPLIGQTYVIFLAKLKRPHFSPGAESSECRLFSLDEIPFDSLAFSSMLVTLKLYIEDRKTGRPKFHYGIINKRPGTSPSEIHEHTLDHHMHT